MSRSIRCRSTTALSWTTSWRPTSTPARPGVGAAQHRSPSGDQLLCTADSLDRSAEVPDVRSGGPEQFTEGVLRRIGDADGGTARNPGAVAEPRALEFLRTNGDGAA